MRQRCDAPFPHLSRSAKAAALGLAIAGTAFAAAATGRPASAASSTIAVYAGTIGDLPVVAKFHMNPSGSSADSNSGEYYYQSYGVGIGLERDSGAAAYHEIQADPATGHPALTGDVWTVAAMSASGLDGTWTDPKGRSLPIHLHAIGTMTDDTSGSARDPYEHALLNAPVTVTPAVSSGGRAFSYVTDPRYDVRSVRIPPEHAAARTANDALDAWFGAQRIAAFECLSSGGSESAFHERVDLAAYTPRVLSLDAHLADRCGGPYPNDDVSQPLSIDLATGSPVDWDAAFGAEGLAKLAAAYLAAYRKSGPDPQCLPAVATPDLTFSKYVGPHGFVLRPNLPHVVEACAIEISLPMPVAKNALSPAERSLLP